MSAFGGKADIVTGLLLAKIPGSEKHMMGRSDNTFLDRDDLSCQMPQ